MFGPEFRRDLAAELARGFDVLHLEQHWSGWVGLGREARALLNVHSLYRIDLSESPPGPAVDRLRRWRVFRAEPALLRRYPWVQTLSPRLTDEVRRISPRATVQTVPLGLDLSLYPFELGGRPEGGAVVGLIGSFDWQPTLSAGQRLLSRLWPEI